MPDERPAPASVVLEVSDDRPVVMRVRARVVEEEPDGVPGVENVASELGRDVRPAPARCDGRAAKRSRGVEALARPATGDGSSRRQVRARGLATTKSGVTYILKGSSQFGGLLCRRSSALRVRETLFRASGLYEL